MNWRETIKDRLETGNAGSAASVSSTVGTWDKAARTVRLPARWIASKSRDGNILIRLGLQTVDLPPGWSVAGSTLMPTPIGDLVRLHNLFRGQNGLPPLVADRRLMQAASDYATDMERRGMLSHFAPDGSTPWDRMNRAGYAWSAASENIAQGQTTNEEVMEDWESSPGHRADILGPYQHIGVGRSGNYWVADFASPK